MQGMFNGYKAGECTAFLFTLPVKLAFALIKYAVKIVFMKTKNHKQKNLKDM